MNVPEIQNVEFGEKFDVSGICFEGGVILAKWQFVKTTTSFWSF